MTPQSVDILNTATGLLGLLLTAATLMRVRAVRRAQRAERALARRLYNVDTTPAVLSRAADLLARHRDPEAKILAHDLLKLGGWIDGVNRALESEPDGTPTPRTGRTVELHEKRYFDDDWLIEHVNAAKTNIDLLMYRPLLATAPTVMDALRVRAERGVQIRLLALSPDASDEVICNVAAVMPAAVLDQPDHFRAQLREAERRIASEVATWPPTARGRFAHRRYARLPGAHFLRVDAVIRSAFAALLPGPLPIRFDQRAHIEVPVDSALGRQTMTHFERLWEGPAPTWPSGD